MLNREAAGLQAAVRHQTGVQDEKERRQNEIGQGDAGKKKQHLGWVAHHHRKHKYALAFLRSGVFTLRIFVTLDSRNSELDRTIASYISKLSGKTIAAFGRTKG